MNKITPPEAGTSIVQLLKMHGYETYFVGGCVRDSLLGLKPNDWDIATSCDPEKVIDIFSELTVVPTGLKHGTVTIMMDGVGYEVTTFRTEGKYSDGRHPDEVKFVSSLEEDLARRDFTINAMAYDPVMDRIVDPFNGKDDLEKKIIAAVGDPELRIKEDHLRMLRAVRYQTRFCYWMEQELEKVICKNADQILLVAQERIFQELYKMASEKGCQFADSLEVLKKLNLLKHILPEIGCMDQFPHAPQTHPEGGVWEHVLAAISKNKEADPVLNLAILFHDVGKPLTFTNTDKIRYLMHHEVGLKAIDEIAVRLRMSNELRDTLKFVCKWHMVFHKALDVSDYKLTQLILNKDWDILYKASRCDDASRGEELFDSVYWAELDLRIATLKKRAAEKEKFDSIRKAVSGEVIMALRGIGPSKQVGEIQDRTLEYIVNEGLNVETDKDRIQEFILNV